MELFDIVLKLTGQVRPVGESHEDDRRFENLKELLELMKQLHVLVDDIATTNKNRPEFSMSRAGKECDEYLNWLGIEE